MSQFIQNKAEIEAWLDEHKVRNYSLAKHEEYGYVVNIDGGVNLNNKNLTTIPVKFGRVKKHFNVFSNQLTNLDFCPNYVGTDFLIDGNNISSLEGMPRFIGGNAALNNNPIKNLKGMSQRIGLSIFLDNTLITSLEGIPKNVHNTLSVERCQLTSLKYCPKKIKGDFLFSENDVENLLYFPQEVSKLIFCNNNFRLGHIGRANTDNTRMTYLCDEMLEIHEAQKLAYKEKKQLREIIGEKKLENLHESIKKIKI